MKRTILIGLVVLFAFSIFGEGGQESSMSKGQSSKEENLQRLVNAVPVPQMRTAQERMMVARRATRFDVPNKIGYVYLFIAGSSTPLGYYTIIGKVASLSSFLVPQEKITDEYIGRDGAVRHASGWYVLSDADIDGTYGENVDGVFFFTDNDVYVEIPTNGPIGYIFSDQPLPIRVPKLNVAPAEKQ